MEPWQTVVLWAFVIIEAFAIVVNLIATGAGGYTQQKGPLLCAASAFLAFLTLLFYLTLLL